MKSEHSFTDEIEVDRRKRNDGGNKEEDGSKRQTERIGDEGWEIWR